MDGLLTYRQHAFFAKVGEGYLGSNINAMGSSIDLVGIKDDRTEIHAKWTVRDCYPNQGWLQTLTADGNMLRVLFSSDTPNTGMAAVTSEDRYGVSREMLTALPDYRECRPGAP